MSFPTTVAPFILRGITLVGIDSGMCPLPLREQAWATLASELPSGFLDRITKEITLADVPAASEELLAGKSAWPPIGQGVN